MKYIINEKSLEYHWDILGKLWNEIADYPNESSVLITREVEHPEDIRIMKNAQFVRSLSNIDHFDDVNEMSFLQSPLLFVNSSNDSIDVDQFLDKVNVKTKDNRDICLDKKSPDLSVDEMFITSMISASLSLNENKGFSPKEGINIVFSSDEGSVNVSSMRNSIFELRHLIERVMSGFLSEEELEMIWTT